MRSVSNMSDKDLKDYLKSTLALKDKFDIPYEVLREMSDKEFNCLVEIAQEKAQARQRSVIDGLRVNPGFAGPITKIKLPSPTNKKK